MKRTISLFLCFAAFVIPGLAQEWRMIVPLKTKCEDLKKLLDVKECRHPAASYKFEGFDLYIDFSTDYDRWDVSGDTVTQAMILLKVPIKLRDFEKGFSDYELLPKPDYPALEYRNNKKGIQITTQNPEGDEEYVVSVILFPIKTKGK